MVGNRVVVRVDSSFTLELQNGHCRPLSFLLFSLAQTEDLTARTGGCHACSNTPSCIKLRNARSAMFAQRRWFRPSSKNGPKVQCRTRSGTSFANHCPELRANAKEDPRQISGVHKIPRRLTPYSLMDSGKFYTNEIRFLCQAGTRRTQDT